jgi:hypothetical protein
MSAFLRRKVAQENNYNQSNEILRCLAYPKGPNSQTSGMRRVATNSLLMELPSRVDRELLDFIPVNEVE